MSNQNKMYFFDFDGVICDSTNECLVTSFNAWSSYNNINEFRYSINEFSLNEINLIGNERLAKETVLMFSELELGKDVNQNDLNLSISLC